MTKLPVSKFIERLWITHNQDITQTNKNCSKIHLFPDDKFAKQLNITI